MNQDYKDLLSAFHAHGVKYLIVGGIAVIFHAQPRFTNDMDVFIKADPANAQATYAALAAFGAPLQDIRPQDFADRGSFFRFGREPRGFDSLPDIPGVDFDAAWERRVESVIDPTTGLKANFISADDLIVSKLASGRPQGIADADAIRKAAESHSPNPAKNVTRERSWSVAPRHRRVPQIKTSGTCQACGLAHQEFKLGTQESRRDRAGCILLQGRGSEGDSP